VATVAAALIAHNEASELPGCLDTLSWADEIVLVDCDSTDDTAEIAERRGARVFRRPNVPTLNQNRNFGFDQAQSEWIFIVDPDERIPSALGNEIRRIIEDPNACTAYITYRRNYYFGRWLRYGGNWPDRQLRLFRKGKARYECRSVHEKIRVDGPIGMMQNVFEHHPYRTVSDYLRKFDFYTSRRAEEISAGPPGRHSALKYCLLIPCARFIRSYVLWLGFLDGLPGMFASLFDAVGQFVGYMKACEMAERQTGLQVES